MARKSPTAGLARFGRAVEDHLKDLRLRLLMQGWRRAPALTARLEEGIWRTARRKSYFRQAELSVAGQPVSVAYLGRDPLYGRWLGRSFDLKCHAIQERLRADARGAATLEQRGDLALMEVPEWLSAPLAARGWLLLPCQVAHLQQLTGPAGQPAALEHKLRARMAAARLQTHPTTSSAELRRFYHEAYLPMIARRHSQDGRPAPLPILQTLLRRGQLLLVQKDGRTLAGALVTPAPVEAGELRIAAIGSYDQDRSGKGDLLSLAPVAVAVAWARRRGFQTCNHLGSLPLVNDGLMRRKLRWGTRVLALPERRLRVALRINRDSAAVRALLAGAPFVACSHRGLVGVGGEAGGSRVRWPGGLVSHHPLPLPAPARPPPGGAPGDLAAALQALARTLWPG